MSALKAIVFDCFGLFYEDPVFTYMRDPNSPKSKAESLHNLDEQAARGKLSKPEFVAKASDLLELAPQVVEERFFRGQVRNEPLFDYVRSLRKHYKIALLSNIGTDIMDGFFTEQEYRELFDVVVLSGSTGHAKPDPEIYLLTCDRLDVEPHEATMVDDVAGNCAGARAIGMQAIHYHSFQQMEMELDKVLGGL